jgi:hypothetical protein
MPQTVAIQPPLDLVVSGERKFEDLKARGDLKEMNRAFKAARAVDRSLRYQDFLQSKKAAMLETLACG